MKGGLPLLWVTTALLSYGHKIPFVGRFIKLLSLWYGRTTWWKLLITLRKYFIVFNAIIGVLTVFKVSGFNSDNLIAGFYAVGYSYFEMLTSFIKRLFNWLFDIFDHKVVPNVPNNPSKPSWPFWSGGDKAPS